MGKLKSANKKRNETKNNLLAKPSSASIRPSVRPGTSKDLAPLTKANVPVLRRALPSLVRPSISAVPLCRRPNRAGGVCAESTSPTEQIFWRPFWSPSSAVGWPHFIFFLFFGVAGSTAGACIPCQAPAPVTPHLAVGGKLPLPTATVHAPLLVFSHFLLRFHP